MQDFIVMKTIGNGTNKAKSVVIKQMGNKAKFSKSFKAVGNIPELYSGMIIGLELDKNFITDYSLFLSKRNTQILEKQEIDLEEYQEILDRHSVLKKNRIGWNIARLDIKELYEVLPFAMVDKIHKKTINNAIEEKRISAINSKILKIGRSKRQIIYNMNDYIEYFDKIEEQGAYEQLKVTNKIKIFQKENKFLLEKGTIWDKELKDKEEFIKENIKQREKREYSLLTTKEIEDFIEIIKNNGYEQEQLNTLWSLKDSTPCVITGGAGVGKSYVIQAIINCYSKYYGTDNILLVAPTGKASRRLSESTGLPANTIHKALKKSVDSGFTYYNYYNALPHRLIIVDESSMIDVELMYDLLRAVNETSKIIFVGDHNQLYPVGYGEPFFDFLNTLEVFKLTINHRQAEGTDILTNAQRVLQGKEIISGQGVTIRNIPYAEIGSIANTNNENTQIMSPFNDLNKKINDFLKKGERNFNVGDKIITLVNTEEYCNGDIGKVIRIDDEEEIIEVKIEDKNIQIPFKDLKNISLAYSLTIHKMQGSEAKKIICFLPTNRKIDKRMLYTAITRAKKELEIYYYTPIELKERN